MPDRVKLDVVSCAATGELHENLEPFGLACMTDERNLDPSNSGQRRILRPFGAEDWVFQGYDRGGDRRCGIANGLLYTELQCDNPDRWRPRSRYLRDKVARADKGIARPPDHCLAELAVKDHVHRHGRP